MNRSIPIQNIQRIIRNTFRKYGYYMNDFSFINLLLHISIIIDRLKCGNYIEEQELFAIPEEDCSQTFLKEICHLFEETFQIRLTPAEQSEIHILIKAYSNYSAMANEEILQAAIGDNVYSLNIKSLLIRASNNWYSKNPIVQTTRSSYSTIYDIAIFISIRLMQQFNIQITEDEAAF